MPPEASDWGMRQVVGRETLEAAWIGCWNAGQTVGYALGVAHACLAIGALVTFALVVVAAGLLVRSR
mgnify:CR=1 FL=1